MSASSNPIRRSDPHHIQGSAGESGHPEKILWLGCRGHTAPALLGHCLSSLEQLESLGSLVVVLEHLERLEDSVTALLLGLYSIALECSIDLTVIDPSGFSASLARALKGHPSISAGRSVSLSRGFRRILFVAESDSGLDVLQKVLGLFGYDTEVVQTAGDARAAVIRNPRHAILIDLDLPRAQALGVAEFVRDNDLDSALLGVTSLEDVWNDEVSVRFGFHTIFGRPFLLREVLEAIGIVVARG